MKYTAYINYRNIREVIEVEESEFYAAQIKACQEYLKLHPLDRPHDDRRRPYSIPIKPYWLIHHGFIHLKRSNDHRLKY